MHFERPKCKKAKLKSNKSNEIANFQAKLDINISTDPKVIFTFKFKFKLL